MKPAMQLTSSGISSNISFQGYPLEDQLENWQRMERNRNCSWFRIFTDLCSLKCKIISCIIILLILTIAVLAVTIIVLNWRLDNDGASVPKLLLKSVARKRRKNGWNTAVPLRPGGMFNHYYNWLWSCLVSLRRLRNHARRPDLC